MDVHLLCSLNVRIYVTMSCFLLTLCGNVKKTRRPNLNP